MRWRSAIRDHRGWSAHPEGADHPAKHPNGRDLAEPTRSYRVVGIGAICDFQTGAPEPGPSQSFSVSEFIELDDGRRVVLDHRGFTLGSNVGTVRAGLTPHTMSQQVLNVVLPDDDECEDEHPWSWLAELARKHGIDVTADELKELQYEVVLTDRVTRWLVTP
jgi:hypothetical protein